MSEGVLRLRTDKVEWRVVEDEIVALHLEGDRYLGANKTGGVLWKALADGATRVALVSLLADEGAPEDAAPGDVDRFLEALRTRDLLEE